MTKKRQKPPLPAGVDAEQFSATIQRKAAADPELRAALFGEAAQQLEAGETETAWTLRRLAGAKIRPSVTLGRHREEICRIVEAHKCTNARVFGLVARGEDTEESDLNLLVDLDGASLLDLCHIQREIGEIVGVRVHVYTPGGFRPEKWGRIVAAGRKKETVPRPVAATY